MSVIDASRAGAARRPGSPAAGLPRQRVRFALGHSEPNGHLWHREQVTIGCWLLRLRFASPEHRQHRRHGGQVPSLTAPRSAGSGSRPSRASLIGADPPGEVELSGARWCHDPGASRIEVSPALPSRRTTSGSRAPHPRRSRSQTARCRCSVGGSAQGRGHQSSAISTSLRCTSSRHSWRRWSLPPPELQKLLGAMHGNQQAMNGFARVSAGVTSPAEFFSEENVKRIFAAAR